MALTKEEQQKQLAAELEKRGIKKGTVAYSRAMKEYGQGHSGGSNNNNGNSGDANGNGRRLSETTVKKANPAKGKFPKNAAETLANALSTYQRIKSNPNLVSADEVRALQLLMLDWGLNIDFKGRDGKMRRGLAAVDGRWGNSSAKAFELYTALLNGAANNTFDVDWKAKHGNIAPHVKVAGRDTETANALRNGYYAYFKEHPEIYAGMLLNPDKSIAWNTLPYLDESAKELLFDVVQNYNTLHGGAPLDFTATPDQRHLNIHQMALLGLFNAANNNNIMAADEGRNVANAEDRAARNMYQGTTWALGTGQRLSGAVANSLFGDDPTDWRAVIDPNTAYEQVQYYNPTLNRREWVTVPTSKLATTVADVMGIDNGLGRFVVNTVTDPLFWLSLGLAVRDLAANGKNIATTSWSNLGRSYRNIARENTNAMAGLLKSQSTGMGLLSTRNISLAEIDELVANGSLKAVPKPVEIKNVNTGLLLRTTKPQSSLGFKLKNANRTDGKWKNNARPRPINETPDYLYVDKPIPSNIETLDPYTFSKIHLSTPYIAPPSGGHIDYSLPYWTQEFPGGLVDWIYNPADPQGHMYSEYWNGNGELLLTNRSANTNNTWRYPMPRYGSYNAYYGGQSQDNRSKK